jgi:NAD(P)-dependent dehydrogenase (short-subunit alcohol dehydrogenase family)
MLICLRHRLQFIASQQCQLSGGQFGVATDGSWPTSGAPSGVRVNVVSPGVVSTPGSAEFAKTTPGFSSDDWLRNIPLGRIGATEDIAEAVALLVSDRGKFLTGASYRVDGGMTGR